MTRGRGRGNSFWALPSFESPFRMLLVMADHRDANTTGDFAEQEMVWEALQIDVPPIPRLEVKSLRVRGRSSDKEIQLLPELITESVVDVIIVAQDLGDVSLHGRVVSHLHRPRACSTRRTN